MSVFDDGSLGPSRCLDTELDQGLYESNETQIKLTLHTFFYCVFKRLCAHSKLRKLRLQKSSTARD